MSPTASSDVGEDAAQKNLVECHGRGDSQHLSIGAVSSPVGNFAAFEKEVLNNATRTVVFGLRFGPCRGTPTKTKELAHSAMRSSSLNTGWNIPFNTKAATSAPIEKAAFFV
jgi:hypothetical protein